MQVAESYLFHGDSSVDLRGTDTGRCTQNGPYPWHGAARVSSVRPAAPAPAPGTRSARLLSPACMADRSCKTGVPAGRCLARTPEDYAVPEDSRDERTATARPPHLPR
jgi:hypothetical protein